MRKSAVILAAAVVLAAVVATWMWLDLRGERAQGSELAARISALESAPTPSPAPVGEPPSARLAAPDSPDGSAPAGATASTALPAAAAGAPASSAAPAAGILEAMQSPQGQDFTRTMMRGVMGQMYPDVGEELGLSQEEVDALFDLLTRQQVELSSDSLALMSGNAPDPAARQKLQRTLIDKQLAQQRELAAHLGARHAQWEQYQYTAAAKQQVSQLESALTASGNPLTGEQSQKIVAAFAVEQKQITDEEQAWSTSAAALDSPNLLQESMERAITAQQRLLGVARPHLTATQLQHYQRQMEQQTSMLRAVSGMMGGQAPSGQAPGAR